MTLTRPLLTAALAVALATSAPGLTEAAQGPPPQVRQAIDALVQVLQASDEASARTFVSERLSDTYRQALGGRALAHLESLRTATRGGFGDIGLERLDDGSLVMILEGDRRLNIRLDEATGRVQQLDMAAGEGGPAGAPDRQSALRERLRAVESLRITPAALAQFRASQLAPALQDPAVLNDGVLQSVARAAMMAGTVTMEVDGAEQVMKLGNGRTVTEVRMRISEDPPFLIDALRVIDDAPPTADRASPDVPPLTWDSLPAVLKASTVWGFSGTVLAVRDGAVVLHQSYGAADRSTGRPNTNETIYDIGSIPIDFTRAAVYLLAQRNALRLDDRIDRFYPNAPADKASITIRQLLARQSGLPNFHHLSTDADRDLTWIDRETAERRILAQPLLFPPGSDTANSHSAFVLLAAIVERVSGAGYESFLRANFFGPAGITRTGMYGDFGGHAVADFAAGHDAESVGQPNIPPHWGPASWLVMGSGGMYSTPEDLYRWFRALRAGQVLTGEFLKGYLTRGSAAGGTDRGFLVFHAWAGGDSMIFLAQNSRSESPEARSLRQRLVALVGASPVGRAELVNVRGRTR